MKILTTLLGIAMAFSTSQAAISYAPVTTGATESAQKLYNFLATNFGSKTIAGIQTGDLNFSSGITEQVDLQAVYTTGGKYPALVGFDFLFANGVKANDSWYIQYTAKSIELAQELWEQGGIPAFSWHWKDPSDQIDAFYVQGAGTPYTTFDFTTAFESGTTQWNTNSTTYNQLISDIDEISEHFKILQDAGVAAIFRPLHECGGAWFWWNTKAAEQYAALYRLVYTRMTETNGIKNLVWVWNPQESVFSQAGWNPGANYYDILGVDIYNPAFDYKSNSSAFNNMKTNFGSDKILALSENGPIPDASLMHDDNAVWSWYMPWYESWDGKFVSKTKNTVWTANLADPCVLTLDKMPGWSKYTLSNTPVSSCQVGYKLGDLDTAVNVVEVIPDTSNGNGWMKVVIENMRNQIAENGDTTVKAAANIFFTPTVNVSGATTASLTVFNTSASGVWISLALLTDGDWKWEMPPDGCWINGNSTKDCSFDVSKMSMNNISKIYIMVATDGYSGTLYFDNFTTNKGTIANFDITANKFAPEGVGATAYVKTIAMIGGSPNGTPTLYARQNEGLLYVVAKNKITITANKSEYIKLGIYDLQGNRKASIFEGKLSKGSQTFSIPTLTKGMYIIRATGSQSIEQKLLYME